jgi:hypothetical protein
VFFAKLSALVLSFSQLILLNANLGRCIHAYCPVTESVDIRNRRFRVLYVETKGKPRFLLLRIQTLYSLRALPGKKSPFNKAETHFSLH